MWHVTDFISEKLEPMLSSISASCLRPKKEGIPLIVLRNQATSAFSIAASELTNWVPRVTKIQRFSGWLSKSCDENPCMRIIFNSKSPSKVRTCADSRHNFWTTNQKTAADLCQIELTSELHCMQVTCTETVYAGHYISGYC